MAVIRTAESHTGTTGSASQASFTFAVGQAGDAPKGILVFVFQGVLNTDEVSSVTYGGVTVPPVTGGRAEDATTEKGSCKAFLLGASVPSGVQSVVVNRSNTTTTMYAVAYLLGGSVGLRKFGTPYILSNNAAMAQQSIAAGATTTQIFAAAYSGGVTTPTCANMTIGTGTYLVYAAYAFYSAYETTPTTGTRTRGLTCATDDLGYVIVTVGEVVSYAATGVAGSVVTGLSGEATVTEASVVYPATGLVEAATGLSGTATVKRAATGAAGAVVTEFSGTATVTEGVNVYPATGQVDSSTAVSGTATVKRVASGVAGAVVTGLPGAALTVKRAATGSVGVITTLSGCVFGHYFSTGTVAVVTGSSATPMTKRAATGSSAAASGLNGTATAKHPVTGIAGAVVTGTSGSAAVVRLAGIAPPINVVTALSGAATVTEAPTGNYATGQVDASTGLSGTANVTRAATGSVSSVTGVSGAVLARYGVTGSVEVITGFSGQSSRPVIAFVVTLMPSGWGARLRANDWQADMQPSGWSAAVRRPES